MSFKENLLKKIAIEKQAHRLAASVQPQADAAKFDKEAARRFIEMGGFPHVDLNDRDLELYILGEDNDEKTIIVLDNGLAIYRSTIDDVAMRKSPTVKEMVNIRNARKILSDNDVRLSKRKDSVRTVENMLTAGLDLSYTDADIAGIAMDGITAIEHNDADGVMQSLSLFSELLGYRKPPKLFHADGCDIRGRVEKAADGGDRFGPSFMYDKVNNSLQFIVSPIDSRRKDDLIYYRMVLNGEEKPDAEGGDVFRRLQEIVLEQRPVITGPDGAKTLLSSTS